MKRVLVLAYLIVFSCSALCDKASKTSTTVTNNPKVIIHTTSGDITVELYPDKAPVTVANFLDYIKSGHYNGTLFHRVIQRFMIQAGGYTKQWEQKPTKPPIINESKNGLHNDRWTIAMARTTAPDSATSQFFINVSMNTKLDPQFGNPGYAVFGKVIDGQHVVKAIEKTATQAINGHQNVPIEPIIINSIDIKT